MSAMASTGAAATARLPAARRPVVAAAARAPHHPLGLRSSLALRGTPLVPHRAAALQQLHQSEQQQMQQARRRAAIVTHARRGGGGGSSDVADRVLAALPYLLPLLDGLRYGKFAFMQFPILGVILVPLEPLMRLYFSVPFASLVAFFAVYLGIVNNGRWSYFVRFNAMQAILLDVILILPGLIESFLRPGGMGSFGLQLYITFYNTLFLFLLACFIYGVGSALAGRAARLPIVGDAAEAQIR